MIRRVRSFAFAACCALFAPVAAAQDDPSALLVRLAASDRAQRERALQDVRAALLVPDAFLQLARVMERASPEARLRVQDAVASAPECLPVLLAAARGTDANARDVARELLRALLLAEGARREPPPSKKVLNDPAYEEGTQVGIDWPIGEPAPLLVVLAWLEQTAPGRLCIALDPRLRELAQATVPASMLARTTASGLLARVLDEHGLEVVDAGVVRLIVVRGSLHDDDDAHALRCLDALLADDVDEAALTALAIALRVRGAEEVAAHAFATRPGDATYRALGAGARAAELSPALMAAVLRSGADAECVRFAERCAREPALIHAFEDAGQIPMLDAGAARRFTRVRAFVATAARDVRCVPALMQEAMHDADPFVRIEAARALIEIDPRASDRQEVLAAAFAGGIPEPALRPALEAMWLAQCANDRAFDAVVAPWADDRGSRAVRSLCCAFRGAQPPVADARALAVWLAATARRGAPVAAAFRADASWRDLVAAREFHPLVAEGLLAAQPSVGRSLGWRIANVQPPLRALWIETLRLATLREVEDEDQTYASQLNLELAPLRESDAVARAVAAELRSVIYESPRGSHRVVWNAATVFLPR